MTAKIDPELEKQFEASIRRFDPPRDQTGVRELFDFALDAVAAGYRPEMIERAFAVAEQMQDRDPASPTYGNFRWYWFNEKPGDRNAVEFSMERGVLIWKLYRDRLTPKAREQLERLITLSIEGIRLHRVSESYTNIFLMKTWNCIAIGEATGRADLAAEGYQMLERWLMHVWESGIHEYLSPTYYGVDVHCLGLIARFAQRDEGKKLADVALRLFWTDIAANWFAPAQRLGGAHSRDYDYLTGRGHLDIALRRQGWLKDGKPIATDPYDELASWTPPAEMRALADRTPRFVRQRWGQQPWEMAAQHIGHNFSLGSAAATYWNMDKPLVLNLPGDINTPVASFLMDARNDPYGKSKIAEGTSGHKKSLHLNPFLASVQRGPEVLLFATADPSNPKHFMHHEQIDGLFSHFFFPTNASVWDATSAAPLPLKGRHELDGERPVFLRSGDVAAGIRFIVRTASDGKSAPLALIADGDKFGAARLTVEHAASKPAARGIIGIWIRAAEGLDDAAFARFRAAFASSKVDVRHDGERLDARVQGLQCPLRVAVGVAKEERTAIEGAEPGAEAALLAVDGRDIGRELVGSAGPVARYRKLLEDAERGGTTALVPETPIEAEAAQLLVGEIRTDADSSASGGRFIWVPEPKGADQSGGGRANYLIHVPKAGRYFLWGRVLAPTSKDDSFSVYLEQPRSGQPPATIEWHTGIHPKWEWARIEPQGPKKGQPQGINLAEGMLRLEIRGREKGTKLDSLFLTAKPTATPPAK
ncbi:MAG TPA: hypothetical protein PLU30_06410 [Verrucomicrobiae bacterium]|nr:hypothetical protein [Verrucomicrobiae bacterium]